MKRTKFPSKWLIVGAMMSFLGTASLLIMFNSTEFGHGFHSNYTISKYMGLEIWSALVFALSNIFVTIFIGRFLWQLGEAWQMPKIFYVLVVIQAVGLIGLSACPSGMFDVAGEPTSIISWAHTISARTMFFAMMLIAAMIVISRHANPLAHIFNTIYVIYALICIAGFVTAAPWFETYVMFFEGAYLFGFMVSMALCDKRHENFLEPVNLKSED